MSSYQGYTPRYQAPSDSQVSYQALGSGASIDRPRSSRGKDKGKAPVRVYAVQMTGQQDAVTSTTIDGMVLVSNFWPHVLLDTEASHLFISALFVSILGLEFKTLDSILHYNL